MSLSAGCIALNSGDAPDVPKPSDIVKQNLPDTKFEQNRGWVSQSGALQTIVTRAPTHEPYPFHGRGTSATADLQAGGEAVPTSDEITAKLDSIQDTEFNAISVENYENQNPATISVGSIEPDQVTGMLAQSSQNVPQESFELSNEYGVGKYGFSAEQLEAAGYIKPGTVEFYLSDGTATPVDILSSPNVWTGQAGVTNVGALLIDPNLQDAVQSDLYQTSLQNLRSAGVVTGQEDPVKLAGLVQAGSQYSAETVKSWINGTIGDASLVDNINKTVRGGQFAVSLANQKISEAIKGYSTVPLGSTNTVNRTVVDDAVTAIIGNAKVPTPSFSNESSLYAGVADTGLTYTGTDETVLARVNAERQRRGLPPITMA
jgi:hypothetical protein